MVVMSLLFLTISDAGADAYASTATACHSLIRL